MRWPRRQECWFRTEDRPRCRRRFRRHRSRSSRWKPAGLRENEDERTWVACREHSMISREASAANGRFGARRVAVVAAALIAAAATFVVAAPSINRARARIDALPQDGPVAIVALSSGIDSLGRIDAVGAARLVAALEIARQYPGSRLLTTRVAHAESGATSDSSQRTLIESAGVELRRWSVANGIVHSTRDEAVRTRAMLGQDSLSIVVVTSAFHTRRACATFEAVGFRVHCRSGDTQRDWWRPALEVLYEAAATARYAWSDWLP